jgi:hypothetical protein
MLSPHGTGVTASSTIIHVVNNLGIVFVIWWLVGLGSMDCWAVEASGPRNQGRQGQEGKITSPTQLYVHKSEMHANMPGKLMINIAKESSAAEYQ